MLPGAATVPSAFTAMPSSASATSSSSGSSVYVVPLELMRADRGSHFDPDIFDTFVESLDEVLEIKDLYDDRRAGGVALAAHR